MVSHIFCTHCPVSYTIHKTFKNLNKIRHISLDMLNKYHNLSSRNISRSEATTMKFAKLACWKIQLGAQQDYMAGVVYQLPGWNMAMTTDISCLTHVLQVNFESTLSTYACRVISGEYRNLAGANFFEYYWLTWTTFLWGFWWHLPLWHEWLL